MPMHAKSPIYVRNRPLKTHEMEIDKWSPVKNSPNPTSVEKPVILSIREATENDLRRGMSLGKLDL